MMSCGWEYQVLKKRGREDVVWCCPQAWVQTFGFAVERYTDVLAGFFAPKLTHRNVKKFGYIEQSLTTRTFLTVLHIESGTKSWVHLIFGRNWGFVNFHWYVFFILVIVTFYNNATAFLFRFDRGPLFRRFILFRRREVLLFQWWFPFVSTKLSWLHNNKSHANVLYTVAMALFLYCYQYKNLCDVFICYEPGGHPQGAYWYNFTI